MPDTHTCPNCSKEFDTARGLAMHQRQWCKGGLLEGFVNVGDAPKKGAPAILPDMPLANIKATKVGREIKMLRPICATCQKQRRFGWWATCTHNPYVSVVEVPEKVTKYEDMGDGRKRVVGVEEFIRYEERPNWVQISQNKRINSGVLVNKKRRVAGFIFPEELSSPSFPNGIAKCCEFRDCFQQENLIDTRWGTFCRKVEAQLVGHDARMDGGGGALEVGDTPRSIEKQRSQLESVPL